MLAIPHLSHSQRNFYKSISNLKTCFKKPMKVRRHISSNTSLFWNRITRLVSCCFSDVTILLSLTVFHNIMSELLPQVSDAMPLLGSNNKAGLVLWKRPFMCYTRNCTIFGMKEELSIHYCVLWEIDCCVDWNIIVNIVNTLLAMAKWIHSSSLIHKHFHLPCGWKLSLVWFLSSVKFLSSHPTW